MHGKYYMLLVEKYPSDDELISSKRVEDALIETNNGNKTCSLLVFLTFILHDARF